MTGEEVVQHVRGFETDVGIPFNDPNLLAQAFTHRSFINENREVAIEHNERLEFLGDAVIELVATDHLFHQYPDKPEGQLTSFRSALVNTSMLSSVADSVGMNEYLLLSKGEAKDTGRARQYILANTFEAFVGALYLDQGYERTRQFLGQTLLPRVQDIMNKRLWQDPKSRFQELAQDAVSTTPLYQTIEESGPDHDKQFVVGVYLDEELVARGQGRSKQEAEQDAASQAIAAKGWD
jgi:ribonuclease-3